MTAHDSTLCQLDLPDAQPGAVDDRLASWEHALVSASPLVRRVVAETAREHAAAVASHFYSHMLAHPQAAPMLSHELVSERLHQSLQGWIVSLLSGSAVPAALIAHQEKVGRVHARIDVPMHLVMGGVRLIKGDLAAALARSALDREDLAQAIVYIDNLCSLALEAMSEAFRDGAERETRNDEAYRLFALGQNVAAERERQRAAFVEWSQAVLVALHLRDSGEALPSLSESPFGLWFTHKGGVMFEDFPPTRRIHDVIRLFDRELLPALIQARSDELGALLARFQVLSGELKHLLSSLFDQVAELEGGSDPLTQVLNRRFLPAVMSRELALAVRDQRSFSVLLLDIDHFKSVNDTHGHHVGDKLLRQVADELLQLCRASDFVFRYGGEEFLLVLVGCDESFSLGIAEKVRTGIKRQRFYVDSGESVGITVSIGLASFDGHPDPERLLIRADQALYRAKHGGRNQVAVG